MFVIVVQYEWHLLHLILIAFATHQMRRRRERKKERKKERQRLFLIFFIDNNTDDVDDDDYHHNDRSVVYDQKLTVPIRHEQGS